MAPACARCRRPHDFDESPDEGTCAACGGPLLDPGEVHDPERYQRLTAEAVASVVAAAPRGRRPTN